MKRLFFLSLALIFQNLCAMNIRYHVSFPNPHDHYAHVRMTLQEIAMDTVQVALPTWTPGSYLIREYAQHLEGFTVTDRDGAALDFEKVDKHSWRIVSGGAEELTVSYRLYCYEPTVRTNFVDEEHATLIGAATFLYVKGATDRPVTLEVEPPAAWKDIACSLAEADGSKWVRYAADYDEVVDSPLEIGNLSEHHFTVDGIPHTLAVFGEGNADMDGLVEDLGRVCHTLNDIMGDNPCDRYLFILLLTENRYNGLEHKFCSLNQLPRWNFTPGAKYTRSMGLLSHEYFHLWNVTRIRPAALSDIDYGQETYTRLLWVAEGVTSYYDDYALYLSGVIDREAYFGLITKMLNSVANNPGDDAQALSDASFDAWIKYYRKNENSNNSLVTYYDKGAMITHALNLLILHHTEGERSFDDVMRSLWADYKQDPASGYTEASLKETIEKIAGVSLEDFFRDHIYGTVPVDYAAYFDLAGLELVDTSSGKSSVHLGMALKWDEGRLMVSQLDKHYGAYQGGLNVGDELVAIDGYRVKKNYKDLYGHKEVGETIRVLVIRNGILQELDLTLTDNKKTSYDLREKEKPGPLQQRVRAKWLGTQ